MSAEILACLLTWIALAVIGAALIFVRAVTGMGAFADGIEGMD